MQAFVYTNFRLVRISLLISAITKSFAFFSRESYFIKAIENVFPVFAYPNINTRGVGEFSTVMQTRDEVEGLHNRADKGWAVKRARPSKKV